MLFLAMAAAGMLTACSNEDNLGGNGEELAGQPKIQLGVSSNVGVSTRVGGTGTVGDLEGAENVWAGQTFWVYMLDKGEMTVAKRLTDDQGIAVGEIFNNMQFTAPTGVASGEATTKDGTIAYYPVQGNFDFWAYRTDGAAGETKDPDGTVRVKPDVKAYDADGAEITEEDRIGEAVMRAVNVTIDGTNDIMVGKATPTNDELDKLLTHRDNYYSAYAARKGVQPNIEFEHKLTRFTFKVVAGSEATGKGSNNVKPVSVEGISVESNTTGQLVVAYKEAPENGVLTFTDSKQFLSIKERANADQKNEDLVALNPVELQWDDDTQKGKELSVGEALLVAPGESEYNVRLNLSQKAKDTVNDNLENVTPKDLVWNGVIKMNQDQKFEAGKSYEITITVYGLEEIRVTATLKPWENGGSIGIDDDADPDHTYTPGN